jgi:hypothetical protein
MEQFGMGTMKRTQLVLAASIIWGTSLSLSLAETRVAAAAKPFLLERGPNHRIVRHVTWQTNEVGQISARTNNYTEIATGLHYQENGVWKETKEEIEILPNGAGAVARQGGHKVIFAPNLNTPGVIDLETPDGQRLRSHVLGLGYYDPASGRSEIIAEVKSSEGELVGNNQVIYRDAFAGVAADVRYTYRKSGFEQDIILRSRPPAPEKFRMSSKTARLEVFTEFLNPPTPVKSERAVSGTSLRDEKLTFGRMSLGPGRAFPLADGNKSKSSVPTGKTWINYEGRTILLEEVEYQSVAKHLKQLPPRPKTAALKSNPSSGALASGRKVPGALAAVNQTPKAMRVAAITPPEAGYVLDYVAVSEWEETEAVFESGQTYYISAGFWPNSLTIQAGAVVKFADDPIYAGWGHTLAGNGVLTCPSSGFATLTSMHDNSVGENITNSTGQPDLNVAAIYLELANGPARIHNLHFKYALAGMITGSDTDNQIRDCQFTECWSGILGCGAVALTNVTFSDCSNLVDYSWLGSYLGTCDVKLAQVQADTGGTVLNLDPEADLASVSLRLHKCCFPSPDQVSEINALGTAITTAGGTFSWTLCDPNDTDGDDLPDAWEVQQFGGLTQGGADDYDGDGDSNVVEYNAGSDPNTINFTARFDNLYVSNRTVTGICEVSNGVPYQMTVLINSTNLAMATWSNYQSSFTFTLPDLDGDHDVLLALRGRVVTNAPVKDVTELTLDRVPPVLAITNPVLVSAAATVVKPYLQLQGYGNEPLAYRHYNLTNEFQTLTNESVSSVNMYFDQGKFDYTTNYFQAFDVRLATNVNEITLIVCDRAGNVAQTNITVTLDFSTDTAPPELALIWPTNDMQICGESFYIRGTISDETAILVAQQVDGDGVTNTVPGIVERNGIFWVENLPLAVGLNEWLLIATDAAGNVTSTNVSVSKSSVTLTVDSTPTGDDLYESVGTVSGTVSDASYSVTVNGVTATVDSGGNWSANDVPIYGMGTATFDVTAIASTGGGLGGGGQPSTSVEIEKPASMIISEHHVNKKDNAYYSDYMWWVYSWKKDHFNHLEWNTVKKDWVHKYHADATAINNEVIDYPLWYTANYIFSSEDRDGSVDVTDANGSRHYNAIGQNDYWQPMSIPHKDFAGTEGDGTYQSRPVYMIQYYAKNAGNIFFNPNVGFHEINVGATTKYKLYTGGKGPVSKDNLFKIQASAVEYPPLRYPNSWDLAPSTKIKSQELEVDGKTADSKGVVWKKYADNSEPDITVIAKGKRHYSATATPYKYCLISRCECPRKDLDRTTVGVAERVSLFWSSTSAGINNIGSDEPIVWSNTGGSLEPKNTWQTHFIAPSNKNNVTITARVAGESITRTFEVIEPTGIDHVDVIGPRTYSIGSAGAGMHLRPYLAPINVSFRWVTIMEVGRAAVVSGFFIEHHPGDHDSASGANAEIPIGCDNSWPSNYDQAYSKSFSGPWSMGTYTWPIPAKWWVGNGDKHDIHFSDQTFTIDSSGTMTGTKFGYTVTRPVDKSAGIISK